MKTLEVNYVDNENNASIDLPVFVFKQPSNETEYNEQQRMLDKLTDIVRNDENHPLAIAMQIIGENLEQYDDRNHPTPMNSSVSDIDIVKHIMNENQLSQKDLAAIFGSQGNVSKFLNGKRELSKKQIQGLKYAFGINPECFFRKMREN